MKKIAIILAGGEGHRAGGDEPKQFRKIGGHPMYQWSMRAFHEEDSSTKILLVCHPGAFDLLDILEDERKSLADNEWSKDIPYTLICGGRSRQESVMNALMEVDSSNDVLVAVHDSARPLVSAEMIRRGWERAKRAGNAVPVIPVADSLREKCDDGSTESIDRSKYLIVQTPQIFHADCLKRAYASTHDSSLTDDASIVQSQGEEIFLYDGMPENFKVTYPSDFKIADALLSEKI